MFGPRKTSNEKVVSLMSDTFNNIFSGQLPDADMLKFEIRKNLDTKKNRFSFDGEYINSLLFNVGHYNISHERIIESFMESLKSGSPISNTEMQHLVISIKNKVKDEETSWIGRFEKSFSRFEKNEKIEELEFNYLFSSSIDRILLTALMTVYTDSRIFNS
jgi:hypothetical protein